MSKSFIDWYILKGLALDAEEDEQWITTKNGHHVLIDGEGEIQAGMGGKFDGQKIDNIRHKGHSVEEVFKNSGELASDLIHSYNTAPDDFVEVASKYAKSIVVKKATGEQANNASYNAVTDEILVGENVKENQEKDARHKRYSHPDYYETNNYNSVLRHEFGHALDAKLAPLFIEQRGKFFYAESGTRIQENASSTSKLFSDAVKKARESIYESDGKTLRPQIQKAFGLEKYSNSDGYYAAPHLQRDEDFNPIKTLSKCNSLSDILCNLTYGESMGYAGHDKRYYKNDILRDSRANTEIFAGLTNLYCCPEKNAWKEAEQIFPELTNAYKGLLEIVKRKEAYR